MPDINIRVKNKIATAGRTIYVCGNSDYVAAFDFDSEWDAYETKTARFSYGGQYTDIVFTGNQCQIPVITNTFSFNVGVFAGDLHTTTSAYVSCRKSILCGNGTPAAPTEDVYSQIMELLNEAGTVDPDAIAAAVEAYLTENPVEAPVTSVNDKTGDVTLTADDVGAMRGKIVSNWDSGNNGDDVYEIIFNYDIGIVKSVPINYFGTANIDVSPVLVICGNQYYYYKDFLVIDRTGHMWNCVCDYRKPSISSVKAVYPTPEEIGAATPDDVAQAAQEAVETAKTLGMTGAEVGQIAKITAVDDSGVPTAWEAVDLPSGGGSGKENWQTVTYAIPTGSTFARLDLPSSNIKKAILITSLLSELASTKLTIRTYYDVEAAAGHSDNLATQQAEFWTDGDNVRYSYLHLERTGDLAVNQFTNASTTPILRNAFMSITSAPKSFIYLVSTTSNCTMSGTATLAYTE